MICKEFRIYSDWKILVNYSFSKIGECRHLHHTSKSFLVYTPVCIHMAINMLWLWGVLYALKANGKLYYLTVQDSSTWLHNNLGSRGLSYQIDLEQQRTDVKHLKEWYSFILLFSLRFMALGWGDLCYCFIS